MSLPETNATNPSEPASFAIAKNINGTLGFTIGRPIVFPANSTIQIIRSVNSTIAGASTVVYEGDTLRVDLVCPSSNHWYFARAYVKGRAAGVSTTLYSAYTPNTFGILGNPDALTTMQIGSGQVTAIYEGVTAGPVTTNLLVGAFGTLAVPGDSVDSALLVTVTAMVRRIAIGPTFTMRIGVGSLSGTSIVSDAFTAPNTVDTVYTMQSAFTLYTNSAQNCFLRWDTNTSGGVATAENIRIKAEVIKR